MGYFDDEIYGMESMLNDLKNQIREFNEANNIPEQDFCCDCKYYSIIGGTRKGHCSIKKKNVKNIAEPCSRFTRA